MPSNHIGHLVPRPLVLVCLLVAIGVAVSPAPRLAAQQIESWTKSQERRFYPDDPIWRDGDTRDISAVAEFDLSKSYEFLSETFGEPAQSFGPALNVNTLGEVPDSSWFTNRLGLHDMTIEEVVRGPNQLDGPAPGMWHVTGRPDSGITPKFTIRDERGDTYLIKLDPAKCPELPSSVELISTKIFHAIGYHVPEDFIVTFDVSRLDVAPGARIRTESGSKRLIQMADVEQWLKNAPRTASGSIRALASLYVPGKVVGQYRYTGTRPDDPNDIYPHERRRELRGLRVFAAWLNHDDARSINSIDTYVEENGRHYVRHYLQDFGSNLGSGSTSAQQPRGGYEYLIEGDKIAKGSVLVRPVDAGLDEGSVSRQPVPGQHRGRFLRAAGWKTEYPQPAFDQMDAADAFWAASIASRFSDEMIKAIVATGELSDPDAARYLTDVIIRRRDKVVAYWIAPDQSARSLRGRSIVDGHRADVRQRGDSSGRGTTRSHLHHSAGWRSTIRAGRERAAGEARDFINPRLAIPDEAWGPADAAGFRYAIASISTVHANYPNWMSPVRVTLRERGGVIEVVGIERPTHGDRDGRGV